MVRPDSVGPVEAAPSHGDAEPAPILGDVPHLVLVVEDDDGIALPLVRTLRREGYEVERLSEGGTVARLVATRPVSLVILDLGLPDVDGLDVCQQIRAAGFEGGVIILTARDGELDRVVGLDVGADDYLPKPFGLSELLARARALLRRTGRSPGGASSPEPPVARPAAGDLRLDPAARRVWVGGAELSLTAKEFDVLALLDDRRGAVLTREDLMDRVWDENWYGSTKTLDVTVGRLRQKLESGGAAVRIVAVRGVGFRLEGGDGGA